MTHHSIPRLPGSCSYVLEIGVDVYVAKSVIHRYTQSVSQSSSVFSSSYAQPTSSTFLFFYEIALFPWISLLKMTKKSKEATPVAIDVSKFCQYPADCDSKRIAAIGLYQAKLATPIPLGKRRYNVRLYHLIFVVGYAILGTQVISTIGEPYRRFLEKADREGFEGANVVFAYMRIGCSLSFSHLLMHLVEKCSNGGDYEAPCRD